MSTPNRDWQAVFHTAPDPPRPLTLHELRRLKRLGFDTLAKALAAGPCAECGLNRLSRTHHELCEPKKPPAAAPQPIRQPWEPRPARRAA